MELPLILEPLVQLIACIQAGLPPTLRALLTHPHLILHPKKLRNIFMSSFWSVFGPGIDAHSSLTKSKLMGPHAHGLVLDLGAGQGHSLKYLDRAKVRKYVAVEPNEEMFPLLRGMICKAGYSEEDGTALILPLGAEEVDKLVAQLGGENQVDTIISCLTLCSVPHAEGVVPLLCTRLLKRPGGTLLMYEHCLSPVWSSRVYQRLWSPVWSVFWNGCRLDRDIVRWVEQIPWAEREVEKEEVPDWHLWYRVVGRYVL